MRRLGDCTSDAIGRRLSAALSPRRNPMKPFRYARRAFSAGSVALIAIAAVGGGATALADQKVVKIGITLPFTGADAEDASLICHGVIIALDEPNAPGGGAG